MAVPLEIVAEHVETTSDRLANLERDAVDPLVALDHVIVDYLSVRLLFVHGPESHVKPVHLRSDGLDAALIL